MKITKEIQPIIKAFIEGKDNDFSFFLSKNQILIKFSPEDINQIEKEKKFVDQFKNKQWTKNQHYIPQFYLKLFSNSNWKIETLDKENKRILKSQSVERICSDTYFYSIETWKADMVSQILEHLFCFYENNFADIYDKLVDDILNYKTIENKELYELCTFVTISRVRWKYFRDQMKDSRNEIVEKVNLMNSNWNITRKKNNIEHIEFMSDENKIRGFSNLLFNKKIRIYISDWDRNFVTSDCCVAELVPEKHSIYWVHFMERLHYFVLAPQILIEFSDETKPWKKIKRKRIWKTEVMFYNLIRSMYWKFLYSKSKDDFIEDDYTKARTNYIELLFNRFPSKFQKDRETIEELKQYSKKIWLHYRDNNELINMATWKKTKH